jgi:hypothetical protein
MRNNENDQLRDEVLRTLRVAGKSQTEMPPGDPVPSNQQPRSRRDFGFGMLALAIFALILTTMAPVGDRWMLGFIAFVLLFVGVWEIDHAQREIRKQQRLESTMKR